MTSLPLWMWVAATLGWCGAAAMGVSFTMVRRERRMESEGLVKGKKQAVIAGPFLVLPFLLVSALLPWATARATLIFTYGWVTPCKLLLLCVANFLLDCPAWTLSNLSHLLLALLLPVRIKGAVNGEVECSSMRVRALGVELGALMWFLRCYDVMGAAGSHGAHCLVLYLVLDLPHRIASMGLVMLGGVETHPLFCRPWLSTSLTDFWGNRWNLTANALLRHSVYNPIVNLLLTNTHVSSPPKIQLLHSSLAAAAAAPPEQISHRACKIHIKALALSTSSLVCPPTQPLPLSVRLIGVNTTFFVSGLIHELLYFALTQAVAPTWEVTAFFMLHGLATSAEITLRRVCPKHAIFKMPRLLKIVLTMCFMHATSARLFFPQLERAGIYLKCTSEYRAVEEMLRRALILNPLK